MNTLLRFCLITAIFFFIGDVSAISQLKVTVNMNSRPDPYLSNWAQKKDVVIVTVVNGTELSGLLLTVKLDCTVAANVASDLELILILPPTIVASKFAVNVASALSVPTAMPKVLAKVLVKNVSIVKLTPLPDT